MLSHRFNPFLVGAIALLKTSSYLVTWNHHATVPVASSSDNNTLSVSTTSMFTDTTILATIATVTLSATETTTTTTIITTTAPITLPTTTQINEEFSQNNQSKENHDLLAYLLTFIGSSSYFSEDTLSSIQPIYEWYKDHEFLFQILGAMTSCLPLWLYKRKKTTIITRQQKTIDSLTSRLKTVHLDHAQLQLAHQTIIAEHHDLVHLHTRQQSQIDRLKVEVRHGQDKGVIFAQRHSQMTDVTEKAQLDLRDLQRRFNQVREAYKSLFTILPEIAFREDAVNEEIISGDSTLLAIANLQKTIEN